MECKCRCIISSNITHLKTYIYIGFHSWVEIWYFCTSILCMFWAPAVFNQPDDVLAMFLTFLSFGSLLDMLQACAVFCCKLWSKCCCWVYLDVVWWYLLCHVYMLSTNWLLYQIRANWSCHLGGTCLVFILTGGCESERIWLLWCKILFMLLKCYTRDIIFETEVAWEVTRLWRQWLPETQYCAIWYLYKLHYI